MKKVLSLVLSLCLFVGLGAGISFDVAQAAGEIVYDFLAVSTSTRESHWQQLNTYEKMDNVYPQYASNPDWAFHSLDDQGNNLNVGKMYYPNSGQGLFIMNTNEKVITTAEIKFKATATNSYVPFLKIGGTPDYKDAGIAKVSIHAYDGTTVNATPIVTKYINMANYTSGEDLVALSDKHVPFTEGGEYVLRFTIEGAKGKIIVNGLELKPGPVVSSINFGNGEGYYEVNAGEYIDVPISLNYSNGTVLDANRGGWWTSIDDGINSGCVALDVQKTASKYRITGLKANDKPETMYIRFGQTGAMVKFNVKVNPAGTAKTAKDLYYNFKKVIPQSVKFNGNALYHYANTWTYGNNTNGAYGEVNPSITSDPWTVVYAKDGRYDDVTKGYYFCPLEHGQPILWYHRGKVNVAIKVPVSGYYTPAIEIGSVSTITTTQTDASFSIKSLDEATSYVTKSTNKGVPAGKLALSDAPIYLEAGEYLISMNKSNDGSVYLSGAELDYKNEYKVTLNANGGELDSQLTSYVEGVGATLPNAKKDGYTFGGWFDNAEFTGAAVTAIPATATGDKVYYAKFTYIPKDFTVTLDANGGIVAFDVTKYTEGTAVALPTATKENYTFGGWFDNADFIGTAVTEIAATETGDKNYYAYWTLNIPAESFTTTFDSGYYAEKKDSADKEGVIAVTSYFELFDEFKSNIEKVGIMIYTAGNENDPAKIAFVEVDALEVIDGITEERFSALFTGIAAANFGKEVIAKPYVVIDGEPIYGAATAYAGVNAAKWLGAKQ